MSEEVRKALQQVAADWRKHAERSADILRKARKNASEEETYIIDDALTALSRAAGEMLANLPVTK